MSELHAMIRPAGIQDAASISGLAGQLGYIISLQEAEERLAALALRDDHTVLVADLSSGHVVGCIHVFGSVSVIEPPVAEIGALIVDEAHRSSGIGRKLVGAAEAWAEKRGLGRMRVRSNVVRVRAHGFYTGLGYRCTKNQGHFVKEIAQRASGGEGE